MEFQAVQAEGPWPKALATGLPELSSRIALPAALDAPRLPEGGPTLTGSRAFPLQHQLEATLLGLGQFQSQLEEQLQWLLHTREQLQGPPAPSLDLQTCEVELAKHKASEVGEWESGQPGGRGDTPPTHADRAFPCLPPPPPTGVTERRLVSCPHGGVSAGGRPGPAALQWEGLGGGAARPPPAAGPALGARPGRDGAPAAAAGEQPVPGEPKVPASQGPVAAAGLSLFLPLSGDLEQTQPPCVHPLPCRWQPTKQRGVGSH